MPAVLRDSDAGWAAGDPPVVNSAQSLGQRRRRYYVVNANVAAGFLKFSEAPEVTVAR
jgi:hypothetical protein